jgi:hypothetical protein
MSPSGSIPQTGSIAPDRPDWTDQPFTRGRYRADMEAAGAPALVDRAWRTLDVLIGWTGGHGYALTYLEDIAARLNRSVSTVKRDLRVLRAHGILVVDEAPIIRRGKPEPGRRNRYWLVPPCRVAALAQRIGRAARQSADVATQGVVQGAAAVAERVVGTARQVANRVRHGRRYDPSHAAGQGAHDPSHPARPFIDKTSIKGPKEEGRVRAPAPPPGHSLDAQRLVDDAARRLGRGVADDADVMAELSREAAALLRRHPRPVEEYLAAQAWDLSGYGLTYWADKIYSPLSLVKTRALWERRGRPARKPDVAPHGGEGRGTVKQPPAPAPLATAHWVDADRPDDIHPCCLIPREFGFHRFDCPTKGGGANGVGGVA